VLNDLEKIVERLPVKMVMIKDDTFTTNRKRVIELCRGIRERGIKFAWSCDTRVDLLGEDLLREMRLAGCERLSLGVESGAPEILEQVDKKITTDDIVVSTELAKKYGISVRYFMMLGNRGETHETFRETLDFLERAQPHEYIFSCLSIYPGTRDFTDAEAAGWLDRKVFFTERFQELKTPFDAPDDLVEVMNAWFADHCGLQRVFRASSKERRDTLALLPDHAASHLDLGAALFEEGEWQDAEAPFRRALELGHPLPGLVLNYLACVAVERGDYDGMMDLYSEAARRDPQHALLIRNVNAARAWFKQEPASRAAKVDLVAGHDFQLLERTAQPSLPGPLPADFADFSRSPEPIETPAKVAAVGSKKPLKTRKQLTVLS
jgi:tetratricopeptide (TPR) repeat protein